MFKRVRVEVYPRHMPTTIFHNSEIIFSIIFYVGGKKITKLFYAQSVVILWMINVKYKESAYTSL